MYSSNEGCYICPSCGNNKILNVFDAVKSKNKNYITKMTFHTVKSTFFTYKSGSIDHYRCNVCGAEWESEIY